jgi:predicted nucleic acid-binding protein
MPITVDTRFFLTHYLAEADELKSKTSRKMIELQRENAMVPTIVLHEVYKFTYENVGKEVASLRVNSIMSSELRVVDLTPGIAVASANLRCRYKGLPTADSIIAGTCMESKSKRVLSDDPHFKMIKEIQAEWL